jgi:hypothetical protein
LTDLGCRSRLTLHSAGRLFMILETVVTGALALLKTYFGLASEGFAKKLGEKLAEKTGELHGLVRGKFAADPYAVTTLERAAAKPDSDDRLAALRGILSEKLQEDPQFAARVDQLSREAQAADSHGILAIGDRNVVVGGDATGGVLNTGDNVRINSV